MYYQVPEDAVEPPLPADLLAVAPGEGGDAAGPDDICKVGITDAGTLVFYPSCLDFYAICTAHGCRLTRRCTASASKPAQGRPLGYLTAWLLRGLLCDSRDEHMDAEQRRGIPHTERADARQWLALQPGGANLLRLERQPRDGEGPGPELEP